MTISVKLIRERAILRVHESGPSIPTAEQEMIFRTFKRADKPSTEEKTVRN